MESWSIARDRQRLEVVGDLRVSDAPQIWATLKARAAEAGPRLDLDLSRAQVIDGAIMALLVDVHDSLLARGVASEITATERLRDLVQAYGGDRASRSPPQRERPGAITSVGIGIENLARRGHALVAFVGELVGTIARSIVHPLTVNVRAIPALVVRNGFDGIPVVVVLNLLVGVVMAIQTARQLEYFGANLYVADIVGISITRELAPLMTAVILSGRSGAAFAAELGTMRVSEEIDALRTMGFMPMSHLVLPRVLTLALIAPVLALLGDVAGVAGGIVIGRTSLDVTPTQFMTELRQVLVSSDVWTGLVKSLAFGLVIALVGCRQGLATRGAAAGVGRGTTSTIVECLFAIVILDTLFTVLFRGLGV